MAHSIDARGRSCPEPVLMTKKALSDAKEQYTVLVDNPVAVENVTRYATKAGYAVNVQEAEGEYTLDLKKKGPL